MADGRWVLLLHSHLPYVLGHGRWPHGESWLYEAAAETYLPLLRACERLVEEGIRPGFTIEISPVLGEQLDDPRFAEGFPLHLEILARAAQADRERFHSEGEPHMAMLAERLEGHFRVLLTDFSDRDGDLLGGFTGLDESGQVELATCARTHGLLPLLGSTDRIRSQVTEGAAWFHRRFGRMPRGVWMPECAYRPEGPWQPVAHGPASEELRPGNEQFLEEAGLRWTVVDTHLVSGGDPLGSYPAEQAEVGRDRSPHRPYPIGSSSVLALPRDPDTTLQVWSAEQGYPGNPWFLEFHKKHSEGGLRYWRISEPGSELGAKHPYEPDRIPALIAEQAHHFGSLVEDLMERSRNAGMAEPVIFSPYDTELFGHWWAEGVDWLLETRRELERRRVMVSTASEAVEEVEAGDPLHLPAGSWGDGGDFRVWDNDRTRGIWDAVYRTEDLLARVLDRLPPDPAPELQAVVRQLHRTVLLIESSDWPFLVTSGGAEDYATARVRGHAEDAVRLAAMAGDLITGHPAGEEERRILEEISARDPLWVS